jgi:hypothetical protein
METGVIPSTPGKFVSLMTKPLQLSALASSPPHRCHARRTLSTSATPRCSSRLAKTAMSRVPLVAAEQNLLMRMLGMATGVHIESDDFEHYVNAFKEGLSVEQVELI